MSRRISKCRGQVLSRSLRQEDQEDVVVSMTSTDVTLTADTEQSSNKYYVNYWRFKQFEKLKLALVGKHHGGPRETGRHLNTTSD